MAAKRDEKPRTRRAERRARSEAEAPETAAAAEDADDEDADDEDADDEDADDEDADDGDAVAKAPAEPPPNRATRRAQRARERSGTDEDRRDAIRDRNRRARQEAAERRRSRRDDGPSAAAALGGGLDATERVDDALVRLTFAATKWLRRNATFVQTAVVLSFVGLIGWTAFRYYNKKVVSARSDELYVAVERISAPVGEPPEVLNPEGSVDARPVYASDQERLTQATAAYEKASADLGTRPIGVMAELGLAGALLESAQYDPAHAKYEAVKNTSFAAKSPEVRGRALEGTGLALEAKGDLDAALKAYQELENLGVDRFTKLALYHRARVHHLKGEDKSAQELLTDLMKRLGAPTSAMDPGYLRRAAQELLLVVDPTAPVSPGVLGDLGGGAGQNLDVLQKRLEELLRRTPPTAPAQPEPAPSGAP